jgi:hypothetical protein
MAFDSGRGVTVLFGGLTAGSSNGETWEWNGSTWTSRSTTGPSPRAGHAIAYETVRGVTLLFGGYPDDGPSAETWQYRGVQRGDMNADGKLNGLDTQPFANALLGNPTDPTAVYICDFNSNGILDQSDINGFVNALLSQ